MRKAPSSSRMLALVRPKTLRNEVEQAVRDAITSGRYPPGSRLIERELCESLGVSRTSVREALRKLEADKLITNVSHKGPSVAVISREEASELYTLRALLEGFAAHEFALHGSDAAIAEFGRHVVELRKQAAAKHQAGVLRAKTALYEVLLDNCGNSLVKEVLIGLHSRVSLLRVTSLMHPERLPRSLAEIGRLHRALKARNAEGAKLQAQKHIANAKIAALRMIEVRQSLPH